MESVSVKREVSSLDLRYLLPEMRSVLIGGIFRKIYNYGRKEFRFEIFSAGKGAFWMYTAPGMLFLTTTKRESPPEPSSFCMFLRKHLMGKRILEIQQHGCDRIVEIRTEGGTLIIELLKPGNVILVDGAGTIIMQNEVQVHKDRTIKPKQPYKYPPKPLDPFSISINDFALAVRDAGAKLGAFMARLVGPGYSDEACRRAGLDPAIDTSTLSRDSIVSLYNEMVGMARQKPEPMLYDDTVTPFPFRGKSGKPQPSFSEALDAYFTPIILEGESDEKEVKHEEEKIGRIQETQVERKQELETEKVSKREEADLIYSHYGTVQSVIEALGRAKEMGMSWADLKSRIETESTPEADAIKEIREHEGIVVLRLGSKDVEIDFTKTVEQNAEMYYEDMKKAKKKLTGVEMAMKEIEEKREAIREKLESKPERKQLEPTLKRRKKWYEKFHWFVTSDGYMVIGGKDAKQNDLIYSKHMDPEDYVFHADIQGASLVIAKGQEGKKPSEIAIKESSEFSAAHSKAWAKGLTEVDVFCVGPVQVSKTDPSGINVPAGSFVITGQRLWFHKVELKLALGVCLEEYKGQVSGSVIAGSVMSMRKHALAFVTIRPGFKPSPELAKEIRTNLIIKVKPEHKSYIEAIPVQDFEVLIPAAKGEIVSLG